MARLALVGVGLLLAGCAAGEVHSGSGASARTDGGSVAGDSGRDDLGVPHLPDAFMRPSFHDAGMAGGPGAVGGSGGMGGPGMAGPGGMGGPGMAGPGGMGGPGMAGPGGMAGGPGMGGDQPPPPPPIDAAPPPPPPPPPVDAAPPPPPPPPPDDWRPGSTTATRISVFYQFSDDTLASYADPNLGLPQDADHVALFTVSHAQADASRATADAVHNARADFRYVPAFDLNSRQGWRDANDAQLAAWGREFRDHALAAHADGFAFNEAPTDTPEDNNARIKMMTLLYYLNEPDAQGRQLRGVFYLTERAGTAANWGEAASAFWARVNDTCDVVVVEHFHGQEFVCQNSLDFLRNHYFAMRDWLNNSGEAAKVQIANNKFTVLHSAHYGPGASGWQGANSDNTTLAQFQRMMSRAALATRTRGGGFNRIAFAPVSDATTDPRVHPRIRLLVRWHYGGGADETNCVDNFAGNCECP